MRVVRVEFLRISSICRVTGKTSVFVAAFIKTSMSVAESDSSRLSSCQTGGKEGLCSSVLSSSFVCVCTGETQGASKQASRSSNPASERASKDDDDDGRGR